MSSMTESELKDKRETLMGEASALIDQVKQAYEHGDAVHELERGLFRQLLRMGHQLLELFFALGGSGDQGDRLRLGDGREVKRLEHSRPRAYQSVFGAHQLERVVYGTREGQKIDYVPLDQQLQLPAGKFSYLLQEWDQALVVEQPYQQVSELLERILGFAQSVNSLERVNQQLSSSVEAYWAAREPAPPAVEEQLVVCSADGKGVVMRGTANAPEGVATDEDNAGGKKMALLGAVYTVAPYVRTPAQVLNALFDSAPLTEAQPPVRPKPLHKYVRASLARDAQQTMAPSYACIFDWLGDEQRQRNPHGQQPVVVLMDGQKTLWSAAKTTFTEVAYVEILDLMHVLNYLWDAAELRYPSNTPGPCSAPLTQQRREFVKNQTERILNGQVQIVIRSLRAHLHRLGAVKRKRLVDIIGYFTNNAPRMRYDQYLQAGYPIATGVIEGACRHVVCDRMERSGMRWVMAGAKAMLELRCIGINQEWDAFMAFHIQRENQRLYPVTAANEETFLPRRLVA